MSIICRSSIAIVENREIIRLIENAVHLNNEAQNAYDFQSYGNARAMRSESSAILLPLFRDVPMLRESFPEKWKILVRGDEDNGFDYIDLERAKEILTTS